MVFMKTELSLEKKVLLIKKLVKQNEKILEKVLTSKQVSSIILNVVRQSQ